MSQQRVLINGQRLSVDDATGAQLVEVAGMTEALGSPAQAGEAAAAVVSAAAGVSSGSAAKATTSDAAVELIAARASGVIRYVRIYNTGSVAGYYSLDGGTTWHYMPANYSPEIPPVAITNKAIQIKRIAGGSDVTGVYASAWEVV